MWLLMEYAPEVHWPWTTGIARLGRGDVPEVTRPDAVRYVAGLRIAAREAGVLAARMMRMDSRGAPDIRVVDREGWVRAATHITQAALDTLDWPRRGPGLRRELVRRGLGVGLGIGFGIGTRWMLGQYDSFSGRDTLYLVAPNMYAMERRHRFVPSDFQRWVAVHEQTHHLQFERAPWLKDHLMELVRTADRPAAIDRVIGTMTFLEGHADHVSDTTGRIRTARAMRRAFARRTNARAGLLDKGAQYANGLEFCTGVRRLARSHRAILAAFDGPDNLPTRAEIADPALWIARVHG